MRFGLAGLAVVLAGAAAAQPAPNALNAAMVEEIEREMVMPVGAKPLVDYSRFYKVDEIEGRAVVEGVYLRFPSGLYQGRADPVDGIANAFIMKPDAELPDILDGGCDVVELVFDLAIRSLWNMKLEWKPTAPEATGICHGLA